MSITLTYSFEEPYQARQAAQKLKNRGYMVSQGKSKRSITGDDTLLVAYPYGAAGGNSAGNNLMASMPPLAGNSVLIHTPAPKEDRLVSILTDDTEAPKAARLMEAMGGRLISK